MSSGCSNSDYRDADAHFENPVSSPTECSDGSMLRPSFAGSEDAPESDGEETGYIHETVNEDKKTGKHVSDCLSLKSSDEGDMNSAAALQQIFSETTTPMIIIPAIKGSREKHGLMLSRKLRVSWAAEVYDPPPSIVSHTKGKKQHQQQQKSKGHHKRNGKKGSSNSSFRGGGGGKDKQQSSSSHKHSHSSRDKFQMGKIQIHIAVGGS